jgi:hypothetical protein
MKTLLLVPVMVLVFWCTDVWVIAAGPNSGWRDVQFAMALTLIFGTTAAVPVICYLFVADQVTALLRFPWNVAAYIAIVALGCALYAVQFLHGRERPLPQTVEGWYLFWQEHIPVLATAIVPLLWRSLASGGRRRPSRVSDHSASDDSD